MMRFIVALAILLVLALVLGAIGCGGKSDEEEILELIDKQIAAINDLDLETFYETRIPNYRARVTLEEYQAFAEPVWGQYSQMLSTKQLKVTNVTVRVEGDWAYMTGQVVLNGDVLQSYTSASPDIWRKVGGKWYDVVENPLDPGYEPDDLPR